MNRGITLNNEDSLVISDVELVKWTQPREQSTEAPQEEEIAEYETHFKTLHINGIRVSSEKNNEDTHFQTPADGARGSREQHRHKLTHFKTLVHILDGMTVNWNRDLVKKRSKQTSFKTMGKSGRKNISSQDTVDKVSTKLIPFKTPDVKYRTSRVHFKTFDDWVKARQTKCNTALKDALSFISEKKEDQLGVRHALMRSYPSHREPNSRWTKRNGDP